MSDVDDQVAAEGFKRLLVTWLNEEEVVTDVSEDSGNIFFRIGNQSDFTVEGRDLPGHSRFYMNLSQYPDIVERVVLQFPPVTLEKDVGYYLTRLPDSFGWFNIIRNMPSTKNDLAKYCLPYVELRGTDAVNFDGAWSAVRVAVQYYHGMFGEV